MKKELFDALLKSVKQCGERMKRAMKPLLTSTFAESEMKKIPLARVGRRAVCSLINVGLIALMLVFCPVTQMFAETSTSLIIEHGPRNTKMVALTFDACPTGWVDEYDERVIEVLLQKQVPATLFMSGRWVARNVEKAKFLASQPQFEIANHAYHHPHLLEKTDDIIINEFKRSQAEIKKVTGKTPRYFRPPYGEVDEHVAELAKKAGLVTIQYDIASGDPDPGLSPKRIVRILLRDAQGGSIIVFHMNRNGVHTAEFLPDLVEGLRKKGFTLVTVGEMLRGTNSNIQKTNPK